MFKINEFLPQQTKSNSFYSAQRRTLDLKKNKINPRCNTIPPSEKYSLDIFQTVKILQNLKYFQERLPLLKPRPIELDPLQAIESPHYIRTNKFRSPRLRLVDINEHLDVGKFIPYRYKKKIHSVSLRSPIKYKSEVNQKMVFEPELLKKWSVENTEGSETHY